MNTKRLSYTKINERFCWYTIAPALIIVLGIVIFPLIYAIGMSFTDLNLMRSSFNWIGLENYKRLFFEDRYFWTSVFNTLKWVIGTTIIPYSIGLFTAMILNNDFPGNTFFRVAVTIPWVVPNVIAAYMWERLYDTSYGAVNWILSSLTGSEVAIPWLSSSKFALFALMGVVIWRNSPFMTIMLLAALKTIPKELYEAATIDGANSFKKFAYITFPQIKSVSVISLLLMSIWMFNHFDVPYVLLKGGPGISSRVLSIHTYMTSLDQMRLGSGSASGVILMLIILIITSYYIRTLSRQ